MNTELIMQDRYDAGKAAGKAEGITEGRAKERDSLIVNALEKLPDAFKVSEILGLSVDYVLKVANEHKILLK